MMDVEICSMLKLLVLVKATCIPDALLKDIVVL